MFSLFVALIFASFVVCVGLWYLFTQSPPVVEKNVKELLSRLPQAEEFFETNYEAFCNYIDLLSANDIPFSSDGNKLPEDVALALIEMICNETSEIYILETQWFYNYGICISKEDFAELGVFYMPERAHLPLDFEKLPYFNEISDDWYIVIIAYSVPG